LFVNLAVNPSYLLTISNILFDFVRFIKDIANFVHIFAHFYDRRRYFRRLFTFARSVAKLRFLCSWSLCFLPHVFE